MLRPLPAGDVLLPYPDGPEPGGESGEDLAAAVDAADPAALARAVIRYFLDLYGERRGWQAEQYPRVTAAAKRVRAAGPGRRGGRLAGGPFRAMNGFT